MTNYPKKKNSGPKSITLRRGFWRAFKNDFKDSKDIYKTQEFYCGYALGLFKAKKITGEQYNGMIKRLGELITWRKLREKYNLKEGLI